MITSNSAFEIVVRQRATRMAWLQGAVINCRVSIFSILCAISFSVSLSFNSFVCHTIQLLFNSSNLKVGKKVIATADGTVRSSRYYGSFGNYIEIDHGNGYITAYGHLSNRSVKVGDKVNRGQKIGEVGNTGRSTAPHLHYEVQYKNKAVDPSPFYFDIPVN